MLFISTANNRASYEHWTPCSLSDSHFPDSTQFARSAIHAQLDFSAAMPWTVASLAGVLGGGRPGAQAVKCNLRFWAEGAHGAWKGGAMQWDN